jgi:hypothetical protein
MRTAAITRMLRKSVHDRVTTGSTHRTVRNTDVSGAGGGGTLTSFMNGSSQLSALMLTSTETALRAGWAFALAIVALWIADRLKPASPRKPIPVRVDQKPTPLYQEPGRDDKRNAVLRLGGGAVVVGALVACLVAFVAAIALELLTGLLGN